MCHSNCPILSDAKILFYLFTQDIQVCEGPLEFLEELNQNVAGKLKEFKSRLEVSCYSSDMVLITYFENNLRK